MHPARPPAFPLPWTAILALAASACAPPGDPPDLNVLLITLDTTRADALSFDHNPRPTSPELEALADESVVFDFAIAQAAVTPVSHASIFTGLNPPRHGLRVLHGLEGNRLEEDRVTLAEVWQRAGGHTAAFPSAYPATSAFGLTQGFEMLDEELPGREGAASELGIVNTGSSQRGARETTDAVLDWLSGRDSDHRPWLAWVHYFDPHDTKLTPPEDQLHALINGPFRPRGQGRPALLRAVYESEIHYMDQQIGRLLHAVKEAGLWERTMVVVVGDHGEGLGQHGWWSHGVLYQEQIRVPLLIRVPEMATIPRVESTVRGIDLMPTILDVTDISRELWPPMEGVSLVSAMTRGATDTSLVAYSESVNLMTYTRPDLSERVDDKDDKLYVLIENRNKLIYHQLRPERSQLYDLRADPNETRDLASERPAELRALTAELLSLNALSDIMPGAATDPDRLRRLRSLGYVE